MEVISKFSSRARHVCPQSDLAQPMHFLFRRDGQPMSKCFICKFKNHRSKYHLHCDTCNFDIHKNCYIQPMCRMSDLTKPHILYVVEEKLSNCHTCGGVDLEHVTGNYHCSTCNLSFHKVCHLYPPKIRHSFHLSHTLNLTFSSKPSYTDFIPSKHLPISWQNETSDSEAEEQDAFDDVSISDVRCKCCQKPLQQPYYHCSICNFSLNLTCTRNPPLFTIFNPKSHDHTLTIFPRRIPSPCDACGLSLENTNDLVYACLPCNYLVHWTCIYLPSVIKITRHPHRISLTPSLPSGLFPCGVCRHTIDVTYGQFSCQNGCHYAVHSKCAVEGRVWDGKDFEGVPEEPDENVEPFVKIDDETIQHFSHNHHLKLRGYNNLWDENITCECEACILPILVSESSYSCMECNYILHEACASLPRKKDHSLHKHRLILHQISLEPFQSRGLRYSFYIDGMFKCNGCDQLGCGFVYTCSEEGCKFQLDVRCASLPDPFIHGSHSHNLFFNLTQGECMGCKSSDCSPYSLECMECSSFLGLKCATLPSVTRYRHDKHPLTLCYGEEDTTNGQYWCEICETKLDAEEWFYACDDYCNVTLHVHCLLGKMFLKSSFGKRNDLHNTREICYVCHHRCLQSLSSVDRSNWCLGLPYFIWWMQTLCIITRERRVQLMPTVSHSHCTLLQIVIRNQTSLYNMFHYPHPTSPFLGTFVETRDL